MRCSRAGRSRLVGAPGLGVQEEAAQQYWLNHPQGAKFSPDFPQETSASQPSGQPGANLELPTSHRIPVSWLRANASATIRWRTVRDILPQGAATEADQAALREEVIA